MHVSCFVGVGQIVLQTAAQSMCKLSYGIEKRSIPHEYAMVCELLVFAGSGLLLIFHTMCCSEHGVDLKSL